MSFARWVGLLVLCLAGCTDSGNDQIPSMSLRPGAQVLLEGNEISGSEAVVCNVTPLSCRRDTLGLTDFARDGDRLAFIGWRRGNYPQLWVSEDRGATWKLHLLPSPADRVEGNRYVAPPYISLVLAQGRIWLAISAAHGVGDGTEQQGFRSEPYIQLVEVDLAHDEYRLTRKLGSGRLAVRGDELLQVFTVEDPRVTGFGNVYLQSHPLKGEGSDPTREAWTLPFNAQTAVPYGWITVDGRTWSGFLDRKTTHLESCLVTTRLGASPPLESSCSGRLFWPGELSVASTSFPLPTPRGLALMSSSGGHAWAALPSSTPEEPPTLVDLGEGRPLQDPYDVDHFRFAGFVPVFREGLPPTDPARSVLRRPAANGGVEELPFPLDPCVEGGPCGEDPRNISSHGMLRGLFDLGGGEYVAIWIGDAVPGFGDKPVLVATRERATVRPAQVTSATQSGPFIAAPEARVGTPLERQCARAVGCGQFRNFPACVQELLSASSTHSARFLAATDCAAIAAWGQTGCVPRCEGSVAVTCSPALQQRDCAAEGGRCEFDGTGRPTCMPLASPVGRCGRCAGSTAITCSEGRASATDCAASGAECVESEVGMDATGNRITQAACSFGVCEEGVSFQCTAEGASLACSDLGVHRALARVDCSRLELPCSETAACGPRWNDCPLGYNDQCQGPYSVWCMGGAIRFADCRTLGSSRCEPSGNYIVGFASRCVP